MDKEEFNYRDYHPRDIVMFYEAQSGEEIIADLVDKFGIDVIIRVAQECDKRGGAIEKKWIEESSIEYPTGIISDVVARYKDDVWMAYAAQIEEPPLTDEQKRAATIAGSGSNAVDE